MEEGGIIGEAPVDMHGPAWSVELDAPGNGDVIVSVFVGSRCVASFDVDDDLPEDQRLAIGQHLRGALEVGLGL